VLTHLATGNSGVQNRYRYGWLVIAAIFLLCVGMIGLIYGWLAASA
jgi:hypothetical protein